MQPADGDLELVVGDAVEVLVAHVADLAEQIGAGGELLEIGAVHLRAFIQSAV